MVPIKAGLNFESFLCNLVLTCVPSLGPLPLFVGSILHQPSWLSVFCMHLASRFCALAHAITRAGKPSSLTATSPHIIMSPKDFLVPLWEALLALTMALLCVTWFLWFTPLSYLIQHGTFGSISELLIVCLWQPFLHCQARLLLAILYSPHDPHLLKHELWGNALWVLPMPRVFFMNYLI